ncbi:MAG TPA: 2-oxo-4-hydroxy-4-carboxy-5-ureidoimidazoline decarboxylase [Gemmatimonadales bacterium]|nr:2-oxo-4-hydroxy-4-carboxy-5-ureidoimidazoline decarboxylase [Gemmatimonadales bacterium]
MNSGLEWLNAMPEEEAREALRACCGSSRWVERMLAKRPFPDASRLFAAATTVWHSLRANDWQEAFRAHPRLGEAASEEQGPRAASWSSREQSGVGAAGQEDRAALAEANRRYEERFGHIFIMCATGKSVTEMLAACRARLANDELTELFVAAEEQRKITRLRLERLLEGAQ